MLKEINDFWERSPVKEFDLDELEINTITIQEYDIVKISDNGLITSDNTDFSFSDLDLFDLDLIQTSYDPLSVGCQLQFPREVPPLLNLQILAFETEQQ